MASSEALRLVLRTLKDIGNELWKRVCGILARYSQETYTYL
jgi:hypothetical protein